MRIVLTPKIYCNRFNYTSPRLEASVLPRRPLMEAIGQMLMATINQYPVGTHKRNVSQPRRWDFHVSVQE